MISNTKLVEEYVSTILSSYLLAPLQLEATVSLNFSFVAEAKILYSYRSAILSMIWQMYVTVTAGETSSKRLREKMNLNPLRLKLTLMKTQMSLLKIFMKILTSQQNKEGEEAIFLTLIGILRNF